MSGDDRFVDSFSHHILRLRGRIGLTQRDLAAQLGVHVHTLQGWEAGLSCPGAARLQALIAAVERAGGFTPGREADEAAAVWAAAIREAPRLRTPFDRMWFDGLRAERSVPDEVGAQPVALAPVVSRATSTGARRQSWGEAPDVTGFVGRAAEREVLRRWISDERCRVVALLGLGGIGKTLLATRVAHDLASSFEHVVWRSLRDAPAPSEWLAGVLGVLAPDDAAVSGGEPAQLRRLLALLREARCLLVLDNVETVLQPGGHVADYRPSYEGYGRLLRQLAEAAHRSCLVVTSREEPPEFGPSRGGPGPVRVLELDGLGIEDGRALLSTKQLDGDEAGWQALARRYGGNGLALKVVGEIISELFGGSIAAYLGYAASTPGVMTAGVRELLGAHIRRLSDPERELLRWLATEREPVGLAEIAAAVGSRTAQGTTLEAVEGLRRRSLLERGERRASFTLHSVVLELVTEQLIEEAVRELTTGELDRLRAQPLVKATARDFVRRSQERQIATPLLDRLVAMAGGPEKAAGRLLALLDQLRGRPAGEQGYGPGNLVNLLRLLRGDLRRVDLSGLVIRQAFLQGVEAQDASLAGAHLSEVVLAEAFRYPTAVTLSSDGAYLAAGTAASEVCLWRVADRTLLATLHGHTGGIRGVALSDDNRLVASGSFDGTVRLWDAAGGRPLSILRGHAGLVYAVALSGDGQVVASGGQDGTVRLWEAATGRLLATLPGHAGGVWAVALSGDGRLVASGSADGTVRLWEADSGRLLRILPGHTKSSQGVALSRDGRLLVSGSLDGTVRLWEAESGKTLATLHGHAGGVRAVALSGDGQLVASGGLDGTVRLWDADGGGPRSVLRGHVGLVYAVALSGDGQVVASGSFDGTVKLWDTPSGRLLANLQGYNRGIRDVAASRDGRLLASGGFDGAVRLWEAETGRLLRVLRGHAGGIRGVALSGDGALAASGSFDGTIKLWDTAGGRELATLPGHTGGAWGLALSGDGRLAASGGYDGAIKLWETANGRLLRTVEAHPSGIRGVALSDDGRILASGSEDETVRLWETGSGRLLASCDEHTGGIWGVALSGDGRLVASGSDDKTVRLWDAESGRPLATLHGHTDAVWGVALTGDGRTVASASFDGTVRLWEAETGRHVRTMHGHEGRVCAVALADDGRVAASAGVDGTVRVWDADHGTVLHTLLADRSYERLDITGLTGITEAQRDALLALGAVDRGGRPASRPPG